MGGFPDVIGNMPASLLPLEIETPGEGQIRALFVSAGNPVLSVPDGEALERALGQLDLCVSIDLYVNETNRHADYVLPATTFYEREDLPLAFLGFFTHAVHPVQRRGGRRRRRVPPGVGGRRGPLAAARRRALQRDAAAPARPAGPAAAARAARRPAAAHRAERRPLRPAPGRAQPARLREHPHGLVLADEIATGVLADKLRTPGRACRLAPPEIVAEVERLASSNGGDPRFPLRMIGMRELRSHNSWMHNAPLLMRGGRVQALRVHPDDAAAHGLEDGGEARLESKDGAVTVPVSVSDEMTPGTVALPHGWGHRGGWQLANQHAGANVNLLAGSGPTISSGCRDGAPERHPGARVAGCGRRLEAAEAAALRGAVARGVGGVTVSAARTCRPRRFCLASALRSFEPKRSVSARRLHPRRVCADASSPCRCALPRQRYARAGRDRAALASGRSPPTERPAPQASLRALPTLGSGREQVRRRRARHWGRAVRCAARTDQLAGLLQARLVGASVLLRGPLDVGDPLSPASLGRTVPGIGGEPGGLDGERLVDEPLELERRVGRVAGVLALIPDARPHREEADAVRLPVAEIGHARLDERRHHR